MTTTSETNYALVSFSPSSGIGVYVQRNQLHEFDLVTNDDQKLFAGPDQSTVHTDTLAQFVSREQLIAFATTEYLRDKKQTYYSTLLTENVDDQLRQDILQFLNAPELTAIAIAGELAELLCEIGRPALASMALRYAVQMELTNVERSLWLLFDRLLGPPGVPSGFGTRSREGPLPSRPPAKILRTARPHLEASHWVGLTTPVPKRDPDTPQYVDALIAGDPAVREHFMAHFMPLLHRHVIPAMAFMAEDLVHDALLKTLERLQQSGVRKPWPLTAFTHRVLKDVAAHASLREQRYVQLGEGLLGPVDQAIDRLVWEAAPAKHEPAVPPETTLMLQDLLSDLWRYYPREARVLALRINGWTTQQIADSLQTDVSTIHRRLVFARRWLRKHFVNDPGSKLE